MVTTKKGTPVFRPKNRVDHSVYGLGTIVDANETYTTIAFDDAGTRKFMTAMVKLAETDKPAPEKPVRRKKKVAPTN